MNSLYIAANLFKRILGKKKGWLSFLILPAIIVSLIIMITTEKIRPIEIGYSNHDQGFLGSHLLDEISSSGNYQLVEYTASELKEKIKSKQLEVGFNIPADFTRQILSGESSNIEQYFLVVSESSYILESMLRQKISQLERTVALVENLNLQDPSLQHEETIENILKQASQKQISSMTSPPQQQVQNNLFLIIGFMLFFVMINIFNSIGIILEDRSKMTMARIYTAPVNAFEISLGNFLGCFGLGALQLLLILVITKYVLDFNYGISFLSLFIILSFFLLATVGLGSAIAGLIRNSNNMGALLSLVITPTCMIGGCWCPLAIMPDFMQKLANFVPQKWAIDGAIQLANGHSLLDISVHLGILTLFAVILLGFGAVVLRPSEQSV